MNINANELLLLNKKIKFGEGVNLGGNTSDAGKSAAVLAPAPEANGPQSGMNALMFQGLNNVTTNPTLATELKVMNEAAPQQTEDKAANEYIAPYKSNLAFQGKASKMKTLAMAALMGLATLGASSALTSCDDKEYIPVYPEMPDVNVTVNIDFAAIQSMFAQMQELWQKMLELQQITNEQLQQNNEFMKQLIEMYKNGQADANAFYEQMYNFMMSSETNQKTIIELLTQNGMKQDEANKFLQEIMQEVKDGNLTAAKAWEKIVEILGDISNKLDGVFDKINDIFENNVEMKDEVQASLDRIESLVEAGNAKVDVTNNLLTELINKYENGSLSKEDLQKLLDAISKNGDKIDSTNDLLGQMKDQDKELQAEILNYIAAVGFEMNRNFGDLIEAVKNNTVDLSDVKALLESLNQKVDQNTEAGKENTEAILNYLGAIGFEMVSNMNKILDEIGNNTAKLNELAMLLAKMQDQDEKFQKNILTLIENLGSEITGKLDNIIGKFDQYDFSLDGVEQLLAKIQAQDEKFQKEVIDLLNKVVGEVGNNTTELKNISQLLAKMENQSAEFQKNVLNAIDKLGVDISKDLTNIFNAIENGNSGSSKNIEALLEKVLEKLDTMDNNQQASAKAIIEAIGNIKIDGGGNIDISSLEKMVAELIDLVSKNNGLLESIDGKMDVLNMTINAAKAEIIELLGNEFDKNDARYQNIIKTLNEIKAQGGNGGSYDDTELLKKLDSILVILDKIGNKNYDDTKLMEKLDKILEAIKDHNITVDITGKVECDCNCGGNHEGILGDIEDVLG